MDKLFPVMMDRPEKGSGFAAFFYGVACFFVMPYLILLFLFEMVQDPAMIFVEIGYHVINMAVMITLYRTYLSDALFTAKIEWKKIVETVAICAVLVFGLYFLLMQLLPMIKSVELAYALGVMLPVTEGDLFYPSVVQLLVNPVFGVLCLTFVVPFVTSLMFYASAFAPICCDRPWLAYLITAGVLALPRMFSILSVWAPEQQTIIYFAQLPVHMLACWSYQKTDNIWTPILLHMVVNLISCLVLLFFGFSM